MSGPMDPERLAELRSEIEEHDHHWSAQSALVDLLADRDHWEAEAKRWRDRCPVTAQDVARASVTHEHALAWLDGQGVPLDADEVDDIARHLEHCLRGSGELAIAIRDLSHEFQLPAQAILAEMAALNPEGGS